MSATLAAEPFVRATDVQAILRLVGGAAELWYEPSLQRQFTLDSLCRILGAKAAVCFTLGDVLKGGKTPCTQFTHVGLSDKGATILAVDLAWSMLREARGYIEREKRSGIVLMRAAAENPPYWTTDAKK